MASPTIYTNGEFSIHRDAYGIDGGLEWGLWRGKELVTTFRSLAKAQKYALSYGQNGEWVKGRFTVAIVEGQ